MKWMLVVLVYVAPADAVNWDGPWELGMSNTIEESFNTETECQAFARNLIIKLHEGMRAPIRYRCLSVEATLPKGAPR